MLYNLPLKTILKIQVVLPRHYLDNKKTNKKQKPRLYQLNSSHQTKSEIKHCHDFSLVHLSETMALAPKKYKEDLSPKFSSLGAAY
ncbi:hypothetical protein GDO81_013812 [Engystomops pustulosus]|uniref:Uncharacterized protein n=1 Tax=Engystomops pustulosus TaxID=76066 RepID=A0AAV7B5S8_ENGPU|nr:hypothetical protein GDO81_013812 [Engystomops pustulosus]